MYSQIPIVSEDATMEGNALILYVTDFMSSKDVENYLKEYLKEMIWINDSSVKCIFETEEKANSIFEVYTRGAEKTKEKVDSV